MKIRRNPNQFTIEEAQTATLIMTEGTLTCGTQTVRKKGKTYRYRRPLVHIRMCDKGALEPAAKVTGTKIFPTKTERISCRPEEFPPDGRGLWAVSVRGRKAEALINRLTPLLSTTALKKWQTLKQKCR